MVRTILKPEKNSLTIKLPDNFVGKVIEVIAFEIEQINHDKTAILEKKKRIETITKVLNKHRVDLSSFKFDRNEGNSSLVFCYSTSCNCFLLSLLGNQQQHRKCERPYIFIL